MGETAPDRGKREDKRMMMIRMNEPPHGWVDREFRRSGGRVL